MNAYTGIGARATPPEYLRLMVSIGRWMSMRHWVLRTGGAKGADQAFAEGCMKGDGNIELYLPWQGFNGLESIHHSVSEKALLIAAEMHPVWDRCSQVARLFHGRNSYQILGPNLDDPVQCVICWTFEGKGQGGTGQALRLAREVQVPYIFDLGAPDLENTKMQLKEFVLNETTN